MNAILKWFIFLLLAIAASTFCYSYFNEGLFKKALSPKKTVSLRVDDLKLQVFYNRPSKRDREIFGGLVPYNQVWRTGANEATTFETNEDLQIGKDHLPSGKYTLWTIPNDTIWTVMFNSKQYSWGVDENMKPLYEPEFDIISIKVQPEQISDEVEQFTIAIDNSTDNLYLTMAWDKTKIAIPLK